MKRDAIRNKRGNHRKNTFFRAQAKKILLEIDCLIHLIPVLPLYRNQSIHLHSKSIDWFLYEVNTNISWVT